MRWYITGEDIEASGRFLAQGHTASENCLSLKPPPDVYVDLACARQLGEIHMRPDEPEQNGGKGKEMLNEALEEHASSPAESLLL